MPRKCIRCGKELAGAGQFCRDCSDVYTADGWNKWDWPVRYSRDKALEEIAVNEDPYFLWKYLSNREIPKERVEGWSPSYKDAVLHLRDVTLKEVKKLSDEYVNEDNKRNQQKNFWVSRNTLRKVNGCLRASGLSSSDWFEHIVCREFDACKDRLKSIEKVDDE